MHCRNCEAEHGGDPGTVAACPRCDSVTARDLSDGVAMLAYGAMLLFSCLVLACLVLKHLEQKQQQPVWLGFGPQPVVLQAQQ